MRKFGVFLHLALLAAAAFAYDAGVTHDYKYETSVLVNEECRDEASGDLTGHRLGARVQLTSIWQNPQNPRQKLLKIKVSEPKLLAAKKSSFVERKSDLEKIPSSESFFLLENDRAEKFWDNPSEHSILRNLKRSVASLLQVKRKDGEERVEDVSGECGVRYKVEGSTVRRSIGNCRHPIQDTVSSQPFGVRSSSVRRSTGVDCDLKDGSGSVVSKCVATERVKTYSNLWSKSSICIQSTSEFLLESTSDSKESFKNADYMEVIKQLNKKGELVEGKLYSVSTSKENQPSAIAVDSIKSFQESLKSANLAKLKSASAFLKLLPAFREASQQDILEILGNENLAPILPQLLDVVAASSSENSVEAALIYFDEIEEYYEEMERYFISLSVLPRAEAFVVRGIKTFLEKGRHHEKIQATLISTLGALLRTYAKNSDKADPKVVEEVLDYFENALSACKTEACILSYLLGLRNAAQPSSAPLLLRYAQEGGQISLEALLAFRKIASSQLPRATQELLLKIFHQDDVIQDRSSRAIAAEILLKGNADDDILKRLLGSLSDQSDQEFSSFVVSKVFHIMGEDKAIKSRIVKLLSEKEVSHYYSLSQKGKSSLFKKHLMSIKDLNVTYGIEMELLEGGLLKRSSVDVDFETDSEVSNLLSVGMFAEGMASFAGEATARDEGDPIAGMELTILETSLRPYIFFRSTSELMGHVWAGTANELTPALQGIFSLCDDNQLIVLHNGMVARLQLRGVMSTDLSASVKISIWSRNSQSQVKNAAALLVKGSAVVDADFVKTRGEYQFYGHSAIDFNTDLEFAETPFKMCLQMEQPDIVLRHDFQRSVEMNEAKFSSKKTKKRKRFIPGRSYALHQNNNELCRTMQNSEY